MTAPVIRGWCPGALRPMESGDGLVVRVRPPGGRLTAAQGRALAAAARIHGNGLIDLTARASLQLRGASAAGHAALVAELRAAGLVDADPAAEARRNITLSPFADAGADALAARLAGALAQGPLLPAKFGFAVDCGPARVLAETSADIRLERGVDGGLILRADGCGRGAPVTPDAAPAAAVALAQWFLDAGGARGGRGRMAALMARGARPPGALAPCVAPIAALPEPQPGPVPQGVLAGVAFGQMPAETLAALAALGPLRPTPWRMLLVEGAAAVPDLPGLVRAGDPLRRVHACTGAPGCGQALQPTRPLARRLAARLPAGAVLHVSGCAKGCAHPAPADLTLTATACGFDLVRRGKAGDPPIRRGLDPAMLFLEDPDAPL